MSPTQDAADGDEVVAASRWSTNGHMIADLAAIGYLRPDDHILDPTYGKGTWWNQWKPEKLSTHADDGTDFRQLPYPDGSFDAAAFDPPYVAKGGRNTSGIKAMDARYGQDTAPATPALLQALINDGLTEMVRVVKPKGIVLVKCQDYVSSGRLWPGTHHTLCHGLELGCELVDRLEHIGTPRPQPKRTRKDGTPVRQHHARRNLSTLFVLRTPRAGRPSP